MQTLAKLPTTRPATSATQGQSEGRLQEPATVHSPWRASAASRMDLPARALSSQGCAGARVVSSRRMDGPPSGEPRPPYESALPAGRAPLLVLLALAVAIVFLGFMLAATRGHFVPQVVDLYVVCQYAPRLGRGPSLPVQPRRAALDGRHQPAAHGARWRAAHALGARGEGLVAFAVMAGAALLFAVGAAGPAPRGTGWAARAEGLLAGASWPSAAPSCGASSTDRTSRCSCCWPVAARTAAAPPGTAGRSAGRWPRALLCALARPEGAAARRGAGRRLDAGPDADARGAARALALAAAGGRPSWCWRSTGSSPAPGWARPLADKSLLRELRAHGRTGAGGRVRRRRGARPAATASTRRRRRSDFVPRLGAATTSRRSRLPPGRPGPGRDAASRTAGRSGSGREPSRSSSRPPRPTPSWASISTVT